MARKNINTFHIYIPPEANANYRNRTQFPVEPKPEHWLKTFAKNWLWGVVIIIISILLSNWKDRREIYASLTALGIVGALRSGKSIPESIKRRHFI